MRSKGSKLYTNALYRRITAIYTVILILVGILAGYLAYSKEENELFSKMDQVMLDLNYGYENITEDFWRLYMPIWTYKDSVYSAIETYFSEKRTSPLTPVECAELMEALRIIMSGDGNIRWIGVYRGENFDNYLLHSNDASILAMTDSFPFFHDLKNKQPGMTVFPSRKMNHNGSSYFSFAMCGGTPQEMGKGSIIIGYDTADIASSRMKYAGLENAIYYVSNDFGILYDSTGSYADNDLLSNADFGKKMFSHNGKRWMLSVLEKDTHKAKVFCIVPWMDVALDCLSFTPFILGVLLLFWLCSLLLYRLASRKILEKVNSIQYGLFKIRDNDLTYRIPLAGEPTDEFEHISYSINEMAADLQENIDKSFLLKLRQRQTELAELQAKFDPHFLYNTLEIIRGKAYENGDEETGNIIVNLVQIFRKFVGSNRFVSISEEMEFCNLYLSLLEYRYDDAVMIRYDIDPEIMEYGIIRNLLQPILENYFVHGFNQQKHDNYLMLKGKVSDDQYISFTIKDNGLGISEERLQQLQNHIESVETGAKSSYGLKNVNRRIKLFYGQECGLEIDRNTDGGATIRIKIRKMSCKEHEEKLFSLE